MNVFPGQHTPRAPALDRPMQPGELPERRGPRPETTRPSFRHRFPHMQISQNAPMMLQEALFERAQRLPGVAVKESLVSVVTARAFHLEAERAGGPPEAFLRGREFAHLHPSHDGSLHMTLPPDLVDAVVDKKWGEPHPVSGAMLVFGPRDRAELDVVWRILLASYAYARG